MDELLLVDGANVVGSVPDGWWRDRRGAAERLRDHLVEYAERTGTTVVLVVEGAARGVESVPGVRVESASGSGDDHIVAFVEQAARPVVVVTADRELRQRVGALGARCVGPRTVWPGR
ncbi:NTP pyrophosphohydrolase [Streptomyces sp. SID8379]|uniref:NYN domain-containing protein n=1 Tax=unclassified Streptomyces TaxID=2593676 RepID=UPI00037D8FF5|nr:MULTISPECIES: NYN domain-containing protein [unclassified Streptomyces]MYW64088.1 NTP pyrophosphohydrolase [Streptomyces sp. SID8379]